jgi:hypothetical protein
MVCVLRLAANCFGRAYICRQACLLVVCTEERGEGRGGRRRGRERGRGRGKGRWRGRGRGRGRGRERGRGRGRERGRGRGRGKSTCGTLQFISYTRERRTLNTFWMFMECDAELKHTHTHTHTYTHTNTQHDIHSSSSRAVHTTEKHCKSMQILPIYMHKQTQVLTQKHHPSGHTLYTPQKKVQEKNRFTETKTMQKATKSAYFLKTKMCAHDRHKHRITKIASRTHIHTHPHTHVYKHIHTIRRACAQTCTYTCLQTYAHTCTPAIKRGCARTHTFTYTYTQRFFLYILHTRTTRT